jgi:hypothetical protein
MVLDGVLIRKYRVPTYGGRIWFVVHPSITKAFDIVEDIIDARIVSIENRRTVDAYTYGYETAPGGCHYIVFMRPKVTPGRVAHECEHVLNMIYKWYGARRSLSNDEPECYMLEWLVDRACRALDTFSKVTK